MATSQTQLAQQLIAQLRLLDPSVSAEIGTPERKVLDTVAQALAESEIDLTALATALDIDSKFGSNLDRFLAMFKFGRQKATFATGFAEFSRIIASNVDIRIPGGSTVRAPVTQVLAGTTDSTDVTFYTLNDAILPAGSLSVDVPIRCNLAGAIGNVAATKITDMIGAPISGITAVTNPLPTLNGADEESDEEYKVRFKNTVFRNLAGTQDQYLALAIATAFTTKANVVGPQSTYREYIQVPPVDDASSYDVNDVDENPLTGQDAGGGSAGEYTTALSTLPFAKAIYDTYPVFISNGDIGIGTVFYRQSVDFRLNTDPIAKYRGDTKRFADTGIGLQVADPDAQNQPNVTFLNIFTGVDPDVTAVTPGDVLLLEYKYVSEASRNDLDHNVTNAVDVYIDGGNDTPASVMTVRPTTSSAFIDDPTSKFHYENYRRIGQPATRPLIGNVLLPLFWEPVTDLPDSITMNGNIYYKNIHYWGVEDVSEIGGTIRARGGIEWSAIMKGQTGADPVIGPYTGLIITAQPANQPVEIDGYTYDKNVTDLQASLESSRQITTDVLAHKAKQRYFKLDLSIVYTPGSSISDTNLAISQNVDRFLRTLYFGSVIQLSDLLQQVHNVGGVDNVRWSSDIPNNTNQIRVLETDSLGQPLTNVTTQRVRFGTVSVAEIQRIFLTGEPTSGTFVLSYAATPTTSINAASATLPADLQAALIAAGATGVVVTEDIRSTLGVRTPIRSFTVTFPVGAGRSLIAVNAVNLLGGPYILNGDFFLSDDELAGLSLGTYIPPTGTPDSAPGIISRPRAQGTWLGS